MEELDRHWTMEMVSAANEFLDVEQDASEEIRKAKERVKKKGGPPRPPLTPERKAEIADIIKQSRKLSRMSPAKQQAEQRRILEEYEESVRNGDGEAEPGSVV